MKKKIASRKPLKYAYASQKALRHAARVFLLDFLSGESLDVNRRDAALQVLHAPDRKGE